MSSIDFVSYPILSLSGEITVPGDKSISHRAIILGAIADGPTEIQGFLEGEDCLATLKAFQSMGVIIEQPQAASVIIHGVGRWGLKKPASVIDCGNSGTSIRLLSGLLAAQSFDSELTGDSSLKKRPMARISLPLKQMGAELFTEEDKPPIKIRGGHVLQGITYAMPQASAQVKSCLLLAGLYASGETVIIEPALTRDHTERLLSHFSYPVQKKGDQIIIQGGGRLQGNTIEVPGDISSAAFFLVAATLVPNSTVLIKKVGINPTRLGILHILKEMGANITIKNQRQCGQEPVADLLVQYAKLKGIDIPLSWVPLAIDEFPIIFIAAACAEGYTRVQGASELRSKESDRIATMVTGLQQLGISAEALDDGVVIKGGTFQGGEVDSFDDHRIAMAFTVAGAVAKGPVIVKNCKNIATSFPAFMNTANAIQFNIKGESLHER